MITPQTIYVIDDDEAVRSSLLFALEVSGFQVYGYSSAGNFLAKGNVEQGVLICDVRMPDMGGIELTRLLRQRGSSMKIILITGNANHTVKAEAISAGAHIILEKPAVLEGILKEIKQLTETFT